MRRRIKPPDADYIKQSVPIRAVIERYGLEPNRSGFICCPFHGEDTPSLKIYDDSNSWYCFGCNEGGDIIDFVCQLFSLDFSAALVRLRSDFNITQSGYAGRDIGRQIQRERAERERKRQAEWDYFNGLSRERKDLVDTVQDKPTSHAEAQKYALAVARIEQLDFLMQIHIESG